MPKRALASPQSPIPRPQAAEARKEAHPDKRELDLKLVEALTNTGMPTFLAEFFVRWASEKSLRSWLRSRALKSFAAKLAKAKPAGRPALCRRFINQHFPEGFPLRELLVVAVNDWNSASPA